METRVGAHPLDGVVALVRRPLLEVVGWVRRAQDATARLTSELRETAALLLRALDVVALQATQMRARSQVEVCFGALTVTVTSGVVYAKPGDRIADVVHSGI